jgi:hypothetical protein
MDDAHLDRHIEKYIPFIRIVGWIVLVAGGTAAIIGISYVVRSQVSFGSKIGSIAAAISLPLIGLFFILNPKEKILEGFRRVMRHAYGSPRSKPK